MKLPSPISVAGMTYTIVYGDKMIQNEDKCGECHNQTGSIRIAVGMGEDMTVNTVIHEVLHAIYHCYGIEDKDEEERVVNTMATGLFQVLKDNKNLFNFIRRGIA